MPKSCVSLHLKSKQGAILGTWILGTEQYSGLDSRQETIFFAKSLGVE